MKKTAAALVLTLISLASYADCGGPLTFIDNTTSFSCTAPPSPIADDYSFALLSTSYLTSSSVTTVAQGTANIDFSSIYFDNVAAPSTHYSFTMTQPDPNETWAINNVLLSAGNYELHLNGIQEASGTPASYGGNITVSPIPEPKTFALMLAGLGALGFVARRRRQ